MDGEKNDKNNPTMTEVDWIELNNEIENYDVHETFWEKAKRRTLANPVAPIGLLGACGFLAFGLKALNKGDSRRQQLMMRGRVISQAIGIGSIMFLLLRSKDL